MRDIFTFERGKIMAENINIVDATMNYVGEINRKGKITRLIVFDRYYDLQPYEIAHYHIYSDRIEKRINENLILESFCDDALTIKLVDDTSRSWTKLIGLLRSLCSEFSIEDFNASDIFLKVNNDSVFSKEALVEYICPYLFKKENVEPSLIEYEGLMSLEDWKTRALLAEQKLASIEAVLNVK